MKWSNFVVFALAVCVAAPLFLAGCGSSSPNTITVTVSPSSQLALAGQTYNFTATVSGTTTLTVTNWPCTYSYIPLPTQSTPNPKAQTGNCTSGGTISGVTGQIGTWTISTANGSNVLTYVAPSLANFPVPPPTLTFTAEADADNKKTATATVSLESGIRVSVTPTEVTVPVGLTPAATEIFYPSFLNTNASGQQFKLVQPNSASSTTADQTATPQTPDVCSPTCGTIDNSTGIYTAPSVLPTNTTPTGSASTSATTVYVVVWNSADPTQYAIAEITLVSATNNPANFTGIYPPTIAAGGLLQDVFLNAQNILNTTQINFVPPTAASDLTPSSGVLLDTTTQVFTIPTSSEFCTASAADVTPVVTCPIASLMTRVRLNAAQLANTEPDPNHPAWILIADLPSTATATGDCVQLTPAGVAPTAIACPLQIINASPALVAAAPDSFPQSSSGGSIQVSLDGGYFGATGTYVNVNFAGQAVTQPISVGTGSNQTGATHILFQQDNFELPNPGLYEITVNSSASTGTPPMFTSATTNAAIQPVFADLNLTYHPPYTTPTPPFITTPFINLSPSGTNLAPSSIVLDSNKGFAIITEQATGTLQLVDLTGTQPALLNAPVAIAAGAQPTGIALDNQISFPGDPNHLQDLAVVVDTGASRLYFYSVSRTSGITPVAINSLNTPSNYIAVDLKTLLSESSSTGLGTPFALGIDPGTHLGAVAYTGTSVGTNIAFIVDTNPNLDGSDTHTCFLSGQTPPCVIAPTSVITGPTPQVIMQPQAPIAYVTPGGGNGVTSVVNLLQQGTTVKILPAASGSQTANGAYCAAGTATIKTVTPHGINAALGGTVIISGITAQNGTNFNGTFNVSVVDAYTFNYQLQSCPVSGDQETNTASAEGTVQYGMPYYSFNTTNNVEAAAINPITRTFAYADFFATAAQIGFISTLDQTVTSLSLSAGSCNGCTPSPAGGIEVNFRSLAWDPYTNVLLAYNPGVNVGVNYPENAVSLINPGGPAPGGSNTSAYRIIASIPTGQVGTGSYTPSGASSATTVYGPMAYDPKSKFAIVANAGSNTLSYFNLDPSNTFQSIHVQSVQLPDNSCPANSPASACFAVPIAQPPLSTQAPAAAPTMCSPTDPQHPCMPQAVQVGQNAVVRVLGQGFGTSPGAVARLDGQTAITPPGTTTPIPITTTWVSDSEVDVSIPGTALTLPHDYALDVQSATGQVSNAMDLYVVGLLDMSTACQTTSAFPQGPEAVAIDEPQRIALVSNYACNSVSIINLDMTGQYYPGVPYGTVLSTIGVGQNPIGIGVIPRLGYAVVANSGASPGTATILNISNPLSPSVVTWNVTSGSTTTTVNAATVGISPLGVAIDQDRALALVGNNGSNTLSAIDLTVLLPGAVTTTIPTPTIVGLSGPPTAIAVDPNRAIAVVTNLQNSGTTSETGGLDVVTLSTNPPAKSSTSSISTLTANPTGIAYDPGDPNQTPATVGVFYATSTQQNAIYSFDPDTSSTSLIRVGINPYSVAFNYQTGTLLTVNSTSSTSSVIDSQNYKTRETLGISSYSQFAVGVDNFTNVAVIADQNNNRVVFLPLPK